jgi:tetratricopeptide (TPR) repeat protein
VKRWWIAAALTTCALAQQPQPKKPTPPPAQKEEEPPEEDESLKPKVYALNPLEAARNLNTGDFYYKKRNFNAAQRRYKEATNWDPGSAEAFFKLGEVDEKLRDRNGARAAYEKCAEVASDAKMVAEAKRRLDKLPKVK